MKILTGLLLILNFENIFSQIYYWEYVRKNDIPVKVDGINLDFAWAGGINYPQFSLIDLNGDGINDLFIFDKSGNRILAFNKLGGQNTHYELNINVLKDFPPLRDWALLRDYNCDGKPDIFSYINGGSRLSKNTSTGGQVSFELVTDKILSRYSINPIGLYISLVDIPAIVDLDGDGDLDILTFNLLGGCVEFHKNRSVELYGVCDSLDFKLEDNNWGKFREGDFDNSIFLNADCGRSGEKHSGSTLLTLDLDANGALDLILGDIDAKNITALLNGGTSINALMTSFDDEFPKNFGNGQKVDLNVFAASYYLDVDGDGVNDLIVAPNAIGRSENVKSAHFYKNFGQNNLPNFQLQTQSFLQEKMMDFGETAFPLFYDLDGDGLQDLIVGNYGYFVTQSDFTGQIAYFKNTGTAQNPEFTLITNDLGEISQFEFSHVYPTLGDLNGDGKPEMLIGDGLGNLHLFSLLNFAGDLPIFQISQANFFGISNNSLATPHLFDVNGDGKLDILCGGRNGRINYYRNQGTATNPSFNSVPTIVEFGGINVVDNTVSFNGNSTPRTLIFNGQNHLFVGSFAGRLHHFVLESEQVLHQPNPFEFVHEGTRITAAFSDLNDDGLPEFVLGNVAGGLSLYSIESFFVGVQNFGNELNFKAIIFPNPTYDILHIKVQDLLYNWEVLDLSGSVLLSGNQSNSTIDVSSLKKGLYLVRIWSGDKFSVEKFIKN